MVCPVVQPEVTQAFIIDSIILTLRILLTGGAGFIGSNLAEALVNEERVSAVVVMDNLETGSHQNIAHLLSHPKFSFLEADIRDAQACMDAMKGIDLVSHQAALGSVPRSIADPLTTNQVNITGTLNIFNAARANNIKRVVYAASSSTYGDHPGLPKVEDQIGKPLSPYGVTKLVNELYANVFSKLYGMELIGLRYFNVYGPKQNPAGPYAAVIPLFIHSFLQDKAPRINGTGEHSRDFTFVEDVVRANLLALFTDSSAAVNQVYNIARGDRTSLNELVDMLGVITAKTIKAEYGPERKGDVMHSQADITKARTLLGYDPRTSIRDGLQKAFDWYSANLQIFEK